MTGLQFTQVFKTFGTTVALADFSLEVQQGEFVSLLGPSGCGKTTALRIAAGFERADLGIVGVNTNDVSSVPAHKRNLGMVFQSYSLFPNLTVAENVAFGLRTRKVGVSQRTKRVASMLELVQLGTLAGRYPHQLSGGQQQRVALARALVIEPDVLLLDEPLSALDAHVRRSLRDEIRRLQRSSNTTTLFVTHDQEEALAISDRVGVMSEGRLEQLDTPDAIYHRPQSSFVAKFVGEVNQIPRHLVERVCTNLPNAKTVLVRPERVVLRLLDDPDAISSPLIGTVMSSSFQGVLTTTTVKLDDSVHEIRSTRIQSSAKSANGTRSHDLQPTDRVWINIDLTDAVADN
jgi:putative spermidine/putrescine transport system ATP-binding protein